ncbi:hypothetical protein Acr_06g0003580 [Actinidia rufa]|uniref:Uncharacterized protein n=1 Tax=Actinidia rufa TaxID=165716 RepID=A0A7J0EPL0_9ERIC|nr:hypothetical protein Acr_06g0003580 [Actinidia rufa]
MGGWSPTHGEEEIVNFFFDRPKGTPSMLFLDEVEHPPDPKPPWIVCIFPAVGLLSPYLLSGELGGGRSVIYFLSQLASYQALSSCDHPSLVVYVWPRPIPPRRYTCRLYSRVRTDFQERFWRGSRIAGQVRSILLAISAAHEIGDEESTEIAKGINGPLATVFETMTWRVPSEWRRNALHITSSEQPWSDIRLLYESRWSIGVSTVTGAPTPVLMASSRASKSRIFCEVDLSRALAWSPLRGLLPLLNRVGVLLDSEELFSRKEELGAWRLPRPTWSALIFLERFLERFEWRDRSTSGMSGAAGSGGLAAARSCIRRPLFSFIILICSAISCISRWRPSRFGAWAGSAIGWDLLPGGLLALGLGRLRLRRRESRKGLFPCIDRILVEMESLEMEILSILPRPRARRRQYFGSGRTDEYSDGDSGELSGDDLARFHGLVLPWSRGFGDGVWRSTCGDGTS